MGARFIVALACLESLCVSGVVFGWPALTSLLKEQGVYRSFCSADETECNEQELRLQLVFTAGVFATFFSRLVFGIILDARGPRVSVAIGFLCASLGSALFAAGLRHDVDVFVPAFALLGFAGPGVHLATYHLSNAFPKYQRTVITLFSVIFQLSGLMFSVFVLLADGGPRWSLSTLFDLYTGLLVALGVVAVVFTQPARRLEKGDRPALSRVPSRGLSFVHVGPPKPPTGTADTKDVELARLSQSSGSGTDGATGGLIAKNTGPYDSLRESSLALQLRSRDFLLLTVFYSIFMIQMQFFVGSVEVQLERRGVDSNGAKLFNIINSVIGVPLVFTVGRALDRTGFAPTAVAVCALATLFHIGMAAAQEHATWVRYGLFILFASSRFAFFSFLHALISAMFGFKNFGRLVGISSAVAATVALLQYAIIAVALSETDGFQIVHGVLAVPVMASVVYAIRLRKFDKANGN